MKTAIIIQARMSSTRLPGKVLKPLSGHAMLWHVVERCKQSTLADEVIVATSTDTSDDAIVEFCEQNNIHVSRGSLEDVLARYRDAAETFHAKTIIRVTSDCPLVDPFIIDESIKLFHEHTVSYVSNCLDRVFPRGLDCEVFSRDVLERAYTNATLPEEREHVTPYIVHHEITLPYHVPEAYQGDFRLTVDENADYELMKNIYKEYYQEGKIIEATDVIRRLTVDPAMASINATVLQKHSI